MAVKWDLCHNSFHLAADHVTEVFSLHSSCDDTLTLPEVSHSLLFQHFPLIRDLHLRIPADSPNYQHTPVIMSIPCWRPLTHLPGFCASYQSDRKQTFWIILVEIWFCCQFFRTALTSQNKQKTKQKNPEPLNVKNKQMRFCLCFTVI